MEYTTVTNPRYVSEDTDYISCIVTFTELGTIPFVAYKNDTVAHSKEIYDRIVAGEFGTIQAAPIRPESLSTPDLEAQVRAQRNQLLRELDVIVSNPFRFAEFSEQYKTELSEYRQALLDITDQPGFPNLVVFPLLPDSTLASNPDEVSLKINIDVTVSV